MTHQMHKVMIISSIGPPPYLGGIENVIDTFKKSELSKIYNFTKSMNRENLKGYQLRYSESKKHLAKASGGEDMVEISAEAMEKYIARLQKELDNINKKEILSKYQPVIKNFMNNKNRDLEEIKNKFNEDYFSNDKNLKIASDKILDFLMR